MKTTRRRFLQTSAASTLAGVVSPAAVPRGPHADAWPDAFRIARRHSIVRSTPGPVFFEGMLLGNGDVGVCVVVRPDALGLHIGKSDVWDIRVSEAFENEVLTFAGILDLWRRASEAAKRQGDPDMLFLESRIDFFREYTEKVSTSYSMPWPRPWPCGTLWIHWDPRWVHVRTYSLDPSNGWFRLGVTLRHPGQPSRSAVISAFVDWTSGLVSISSDQPVPLLSLNYYPELDRVRREDRARLATMTLLPRPELESTIGANFAEFSCFQYFPAAGPTKQAPAPPRSAKDRNFSLFARVQGKWSPEGAAKGRDALMKQTNIGNPVTRKVKAHAIHLASGETQPLRIDIKVATPRDLLLERLEREAAARGEEHPWILIPQDHTYSAADLDTKSYAAQEARRFASIPVEASQQRSESQWRNFWSRSAVALADQELEKIWYHNQYFLACCLRERKVAPGLFGNWSAGGIGTAWHSDYHMDYNCQQVFWGVFSSNHAEQHLPYVELCHNTLAMSEKYAAEKFGLPGAYFPHSVYPVPSQMVPYPVPPWGYQISETPWTVQSLWWQYLYTQDVEYLRRVYPMLRAAARFMAAYVKKGDDGKYHVIPTVSSENWGFTVDFRLNQDCILDLALTRFLLHAVIEASATLGEDDFERGRWKEIGSNLASYPRARGPYGDVWLDVRNAPVEWIYNIPLTMAPVFPGEQVGIGLNGDEWEIARRTAALLRLEGGNDLVFQPLIRARLGMLDLSWFKGQVRYCSLPDGIANDRVRQVGGRYADSTDFDFMMRMGVWTENLALPVVLNECMLQSYSGTLRLFPNTHGLGPARFRHLRAAGAFLVSASHDGKQVTSAIILSEKGKTVRLAPPWPGQGIRVFAKRGGQAVTVREEEGTFIFPTQPGDEYVVMKAS